MLAVGALSIWLGFRLFNTARNEGRIADSAGSVRAKSGGIKLAMTNILPGTYFALFGTVIIGMMLRQSPPQMSMKDIKETPDTGTTMRTTLNIRTDSDIHLDGSLRQTAPKEQAAIDREWEKLDKPDLTLEQAAQSFSNIARIWQRENRIGEAVAMARLAALYGTGEKRADYLYLLAELLTANGDKEKAAETLRAAEAMREGR